MNERAVSITVWACIVCAVGALAVLSWLESSASTVLADSIRSTGDCKQHEQWVRCEGSMSPHPELTCPDGKYEEVTTFACGADGWLRREFKPFVRVRDYEQQKRGE